MTTAIVNWEQLKHDVATAHSIDDLKEIRDKSEALRLYSKRQKDSVDMQNKFAEITLRCERRAGEMLREMPKQHGARPADMGLHHVTPLPPTLSDLGISKRDSSNWQAIADLDEETFEQHIIETKENHQELTTVGLVQLAKGGVPAALQMSESNEWYTPQKYIEAARELMGGIDIDPASCAFANETVKAARYYDIIENGLDKDWMGRVWLNPPYGFDVGASNQEVWSTRLVSQYEAGITTEAVLLVNAVTDRKWFQQLWRFLICFTDHRIRFYNAEVEAGQPTHGNALIYIGSQEERFTQLFKQFGPIVRRIDC